MKATEEIELKNNKFEIEKNQSIKSIISLNIDNFNIIESFFAEVFLSINSKYINNVHYGTFIFPNKISMSFYPFIVCLYRKMK